LVGRTVKAGKGTCRQAGAAPQALASTDRLPTCR